MGRLEARLSDHASAGWENWAAVQGVTLTALLEALGLELAEQTPDLTSETKRLLRRTVKRAREIQRERSRRR
jgi:hypothetical protein